MARRSRYGFPGGRRGRRGGRSRGRRSMTRTIGMGLFLRSTVGQVWFLAYAVKTHPLIAAFLVTLTTIYFESGSG
jgi:hypothetical protein